MDYPYGFCDCNEGIAASDGEGCCMGTGPAAYQVIRRGEPKKLCTRCYLRSDKNRVPLVKEIDKLDLFADYDVLGFLALCEAIRREMRKGESRDANNSTDGTVEGNEGRGAVQGDRA